MEQLKPHTHNFFTDYVNAVPYNEIADLTVLEAVSDLVFYQWIVPLAVIGV